MGLPYILGEINQDITIDYYMGLGDGPADFSWWAADQLSEKEFETLFNSNEKETLLRELYIKYLNHKSELWEDREIVANQEELHKYILDRAYKMNHRWALEKQQNGGFNTMDYYTLHPEEFESFLRARNSDLSEPIEDVIREILDQIDNG